MSTYYVAEAENDVYRNYTLCACVANILESIENGETKIVDNIIKHNGDAATPEEIRMAINYVKRGLKMIVFTKMVAGKMHIFMYHKMDFTSLRP